VSCILSNSLYALATIWYAYITHLGYRSKLFFFEIIVLLILTLPYISPPFHVFSSSFLGKYSTFLLVSDCNCFMFMGHFNYYNNSGIEDKLHKNCYGFSFWLSLSLFVDSLVINSCLFINKNKNS
jgi:hypothetical protein